ECVLSDLEKIAAILDMYRNFFAHKMWVPLDKSEGLVKQKLSLAMRKHRCVSQRVLTTEDTGKHP
ncbi:MAG: hypothetical protein ACRD72_26520, partial [Candidatus Angelobacter sp.]